jgi:hypothetical protein
MGEFSKYLNIKYQNYKFLNFEDIIIKSFIF